jgi:hypothetical protein
LSASSIVAPVFRGCTPQARGNLMPFDEYAARAAECQQKAKTARSDEDMLSWLTLADSWLKTAELQRLLKRQSQFF